MVGICTDHETSAASVYVMEKRFHAFSCEGSVYPISLNLVYIAISLNLVCIAISLKNRTCTSFMEKQSKAAF